MALAMEVWSHMTAQRVQPTPEEYVGMIKGWAAAGELRRRAADGLVEAFLGQLGGMAFELEPIHCHEAADDATADDYSCDGSSDKGGKGAGVHQTTCISLLPPSPPLVGRF